MSYKSRRRKRVLVRVVGIVLLCVLIVAAISAFTVYSLLSRKLNKLNAGASYEFDYKITSTTQQAPQLFTILQGLGGDKGTVSGTYSSGTMQMTLAVPDANGNNAALTRLYISPDETLYDVGQLYSNLRSQICTEVPLAGMLIPTWDMGNYISQTQLASVLGIDDTAVALQGVTTFQVDLLKLEQVKPENAMDGYFYFQLNSAEANADAPQLVVGVQKDAIFKAETPLHLLLTIPEHQVTVELTGTLTAKDVVLTAPDSRLNDSDVDTLVKLRQTIESVVAFVQENASESAAQLQTALQDVAV